VSSSSCSTPPGVSTVRGPDPSLRRASATSFTENCLRGRQKRGEPNRPACYRVSKSIISDAPIRTDAMAKGKVDFFNDTGGYGFIETEDADEDVFFHMEDVGGPDLEEGQEIEFDIEQAPKGPRATNVERL